MEINLLAVSIGIGLVISLLFAEVFGLAAGGLVVPGYIALFLTQPHLVLMTLAAGWLTFLIVRLLSSFIIVYGRRRTAMMILIGYLVGVGMSLLTGGGVAFGGGPATVDGSLVPLPRAPAFLELTVIGYIIPGLLAIWFDRQGVLQTLSGLFTTAVAVRLILILALPDALLEYELRHPNPWQLWTEWMNQGATA